jgi:hypothetical protein
MGAGSIVLGEDIAADRNRNRVRLGEAGLMPADWKRPGRGRRDLAAEWLAANHPDALRDFPEAS